MFHVIKQPCDQHGLSGDIDRIELTDELCETIAKRNGYLTAAQVHHDLCNGKTIYTNFSKYVLE